MNLELVEQIVALIGEHPLSEITVESEGLKVRVCRPLTAAAPEEIAPMSTPELPVEPEVVLPETYTLTASMVGIFHHTTPPLPYAALVTEGQVIGSIESMKLMNEVSAEYGGRIIETMTEDGAAVEYGQPLFRLSAV